MKYPIIFLSVFLLSLYSCSSVRVLNTQAEEGFNLSEYQTYNFYTSETGGDQVLQQYQEEMDLLKEEIARALESRGLRQSADPDLLVNVGAVVEEKAQTRETNFRDAPRYIGQRRYSWKREEIVVQKYNLGTVTLELVNEEQNELVWRGVAEGVVPEEEEELKENIAEGVQKLFKQIPTQEN